LGVIQLLEQWLEPFLRRAIEAGEPAIQDMIEKWLSTPDGKRAVASIFSELLVEALLPAMNDGDSLLADVLVGVVQRCSGDGALGRRLLTAAVPDTVATP
jgi:hypothetical protein